MNALLVLYAGDLSGEAARPVFLGKSSLSLAAERSRLFPGVAKIVVLAGPPRGPMPPGALEALAGGGALVERRDGPWTARALFEAVAAHSAGMDLAYLAWADCPFLDPALAARLADRHLRYAAEYSYADGWPYGLAPEILAPETASALAGILGDGDGGPAGRGAAFSAIQRDINAFDIETEISPVDLRPLRLSLCADSKRNLLLLRRLAEGGGAVPDAAAVERAVGERPGALRTLPAFYPIQVFGGCPQSCSYCPWPLASDRAVTERRDFMDARRFEALLDKIAAFSGDAVVGLSLWGELSLHPQKAELVEAALGRPELALVIETSGVGWKGEELEKISRIARNAPPRLAPSPAALSWIVSLDSADPERYREMRGAGFAEAGECAKRLASLFPKDAYAQAVRTEGAEDDIERFYRAWKEAAGANAIIQKYDDFCGMLPRRQASDLSPVQRHPCWHVMRDMPILIDGTVPLCRQQVARQRSGGQVALGNAFDEDLEAIWERGEPHHEAQASAAGAARDPLCAGCDEYYTYNF